MIKRISEELALYGMRGLLHIYLVAFLPRRRALYRRFKTFFQSKTGLEIGGPSGIFKMMHLLPVYTLAARVDNCNFGSQTLWENNLKEGNTFYFEKRRAPGRQFIAEATDLKHLAKGSYDFILSSHCLEHVANPLQALAEWTRVLKEDGLLVLVVPHKDGTFDHRRPVTSMEHLQADFDRQTGEDDSTHVEEILRLHDLTKDPRAGDFQDFEKRSLRNWETRSLHHHVFDTRLAVESVNHIGLQILAVEVFRPYHIVVIAQKPQPGQNVRNDRFRGLDKPACWRSPFPSDRFPFQEVV